MKPRIAFVGVAHWHAPIYRDCLSRLGVDVVGASDLDAQAGREAAARTTTHGHGEGVDEYASALMTLPGGAVMQMEAGYSWAPSAGGDFEWRIATTGAYLQQGQRRLVVRMADGRVEELETVQPSYQPMVERVLADFASGRPPFATLAECAAATALCDRVYEAAARPG